MIRELFHKIFMYFECRKNFHSHNELGYHARVFAVEEQANALRLTLEDEDGRAFEGYSVKLTFKRPFSRCVMQRLFYVMVMVI